MSSQHSTQELLARAKRRAVTFREQTAMGNLAYANRADAQMLDALVEQLQAAEQDSERRTDLLNEALNQRDELKEQYQAALTALRGSQGHVPYFGRHTETIWCERCGPNTPWPCEQTTDEAKLLLSNPARSPEDDS